MIEYKDNSLENNKFSEKEALFKLGEESGNKMEVVRDSNTFKEIREYKLSPEIAELEDESIKDFIKESIKDIIDFDNKPIIKDSFGKDHSSRRKWHQGKLNHYHLKEVIKYYGDNLLKKNNLLTSFHIIQIILRSDVMSGPELNKLSEIGDKIHLYLSKYNSLEIEEKIEVIEKIRGLNQELLGIITIPIDK